MPESNIWKFDDRILLPGTLTSWEPCHGNQKNSFHGMQPIQRIGISSHTAQAYFLAQIAMCRMVRRCTTSVIISQEQETFSPVIAIELTYQLNTWYSRLPPEIRFVLQDLTAENPSDFVNNTSSPPSSGVSAITQFLQMQYYLCLTGIYWPAVYSVIIKESLQAVPAGHPTQFFESYVGFVITAASVIPRCPQNPWSIYARYLSFPSPITPQHVEKRLVVLTSQSLHSSLFITTMACFKAANNSLFQPDIPTNLFRCFAIAAELFKTGDAVTISPAIGNLGLILRERILGIL